MATYAIGDVQGMMQALERLLDRIDFDARRDRLWFAGDLVNRGPHSAAVVRFVRSLGSSAATVLGNHDLQLIAVATGHAATAGKDTFDDVLSAPDRDALVAWLRAQPFVHAEAGWTMVHAGILPAWTIAEACERADELRATLAADGAADWLRTMWDEPADAWNPALHETARTRFLINAFTQLCVCRADGRPDFSGSGGLDTLQPGSMPWFEVPARASRGSPIVFGHWSKLGLVLRDDVAGLDSGCAWGRPSSALTALRLEDRKLFQVSCTGLPGSAAMRGS